MRISLCVNIPAYMSDRGIVSVSIDSIVDRAIRSIPTLKNRYKTAYQLSISIDMLSIIILSIRYLLLFGIRLGS